MKFHPFPEEAFLIVLATFLIVTSGSEQIPLLAGNGSVNWQGLCPHRNFCTTTAKIQLPLPKTSCCQKCSCTPDCYEVGTCCPDMPGIEHKSPKYHCRDITYFGHPKPSTIGKSGIAYRVVDDCPEVSQVYIPRENVSAKTLDDLLFVSDPHSERIFRNRHYALCNNLTDYVQWKLQVQGCPEIIHQTFESQVDRDQYILNNCIISSWPSEDVDPSMLRCKEELLGRLPEFCQYPKVLATELDIDLLKALCTQGRFTQSTLFIHQKEGQRNSLYPNIFCHICDNGLKELQDVCFVSDSDDYAKSSLSAFSMLIDVKTYDFMTQNDDVCDINSIWDPYQEMCHSIHCPTGTVKAGKICVQVYQKVQWIAVSLHFRVNISKGFSVDVSVINRIIDVRLIKIFQTLNADCGLCDQQAYVEQTGNRTDEFYLQFSVHTTNTCSLKTILEAARYIKAKEKIVLRMLYKGKRFQITYRLITENILDSTERKTVSFILRKTCTVTVQTVSLMLLDCPFFILDPQALQMPGFSDRQQYEFIRQSLMTTIQNSLAICKDTYFSLYSASSVFFTNATVFLFFVCFTCRLFLKEIM